MATVIQEPGRTFGEYSLLPSLTTKKCNIPDINLETRLADSLTLKIPILSAAMRSVTGYEMALALGKEGGIGILPAGLSIEEQQSIVRKIKEYEMGFVEDPITVRETKTIEEVLREVNTHGHSKIPIVDRNNYFLGLFDHGHYLTVSSSITDNVTSVMITFENGEIPYCALPDITIEQAKELLAEKKANYLVVLDNQKRLVKLAFKKDVKKIPVGAAISTHPGWQERVKGNVAAGVDLIVIDTSDAYSEWVGDVISEYKKMKIGVPLCAGNIVTYEGALYLMQKGADIVKVGMSSGSICTTQREKATGRAPMTALMEAAKAREYYEKEKQRYVPLISDGGITGARDMIIALTHADAVMLGGYLNRFYEAAGEKLDEDGTITTDETKMKRVVTFGEGSARAQNLDRYGHTSKKTFFTEGAEGTVLYEGRLKPTLKADLIRIKAAFVNEGGMDLPEFREKAVIELNSPNTSQVVSTTHSIEEKK